MARCEAFITPSHTFRRCKREAVEGRFCLEHQPRERPSGYLPRSYIYKLRPTLAEAVEKQLNGSELLEQLSLDEELALIRVAANEFIDLYGAACEKRDSLKPEVVQACAQAMTVALQEVVKATNDAGKVLELKARLKTGLASAFEDVITLVTHAAYDVWGHDHKVGEFEKAIREKLKTSAVIGTSITPDQDAIDMDATVP